jgi:hypothetical protein
MAALGYATPLASGNKTSGFANVTTNFDVYEEIMTSAMIFDTSMKQTPHFRARSNGVERSHGFLTTASWKYMLANGTNIALLPTFIGANHYTNVNLIDGDNVVFGTAANDTNGVIKCKLVVEGDADKDRYIEMSVQRAGVWTHASAYDNDVVWGAYTPSAAVALFTGTTYPTSSSRLFELRATDTYETLGEIRNVKFSADFLVDMTKELSYIPRNVEIKYEVEVMNLVAGNKLLQDSLHTLASPANMRFTLMDGAIFTGPTNGLGCMCEVLYDGDADKNAILRFYGSGFVERSAFAGLWS